MNPWDWNNNWEISELSSHVQLAHTLRAGAEPASSVSQCRTEVQHDYEINIRIHHYQLQSPRETREKILQLRTANIQKKTNKKKTQKLWMNIAPSVVVVDVCSHRNICGAFMSVWAWMWARVHRSTDCEVWRSSVHPASSQSEVKEGSGARTEDICPLVCLLLRGFTHAAKNTLQQTAKTGWDTKTE